MHINISKVTSKRTERVSMTSKKTGVINRMWKNNLKKRRKRKKKKRKERRMNSRGGGRKKKRRGGK